MVSCIWTRRNCRQGIHGWGSPWVRWLFVRTLDPGSYFYGVFMRETSLCKTWGFMRPEQFLYPPDVNLLSLHVRCPSWGLRPASGPLVDCGNDFCRNGLPCGKLWSILGPSDLGWCPCGLRLASELFSSVVSLHHITTFAKSGRIWILKHIWCQDFCLIRD